MATLLIVKYARDKNLVKVEVVKKMRRVEIKTSVRFLRLSVRRLCAPGKS